jgi:hypothetical protein
MLAKVIGIKPNYTIPNKKTLIISIYLKTKNKRNIYP